MTHAASLGLEVMKACNEMETPELDETEEVAE